ncbi:MAG TPA: SRPBCC domain-containing protein [Gemmatimonadaceae bacterium]
MPIRKEGDKRWVEMELLVPGTPEQVWQAMATGPGNAAWFVTADIEPRVGGAFRIDFGNGVTSSGDVTRWNPPHQFGYVERDWEPDAPPIATEITITSRSGDHCVVRMVHSLFTSSDDWDTQVEGFEKGWPGFFAVLRVYLKHFAGMRASSFMAMQSTPVDVSGAWQRVTESSGVAGANVGEHRTAQDGPEAWSGIVEHVYQDSQQRLVVLRIVGPSPGIVLLGTLAPPETLADIEVKVGMGAGTNVSVARYFYGENAEALAAVGESRWREWLARMFAT